MSYLQPVYPGKAHEKAISLQSVAEQPAVDAKRSAATLALLTSRKPLSTDDIHVLTTVFDTSPDKTPMELGVKPVDSIANGQALDALLNVPLAFWTARDVESHINRLEGNEPILRLALFYLHRDPLDPAGKHPGSLLSAAARACSRADISKAFIAETADVLCWYADEAERSIWSSFVAKAACQGLSGTEMDEMKSKIDGGRFSALPAFCLPTIEALQAIAAVRGRLRGADILATASALVQFEEDDLFQTPIGQPQTTATENSPTETLFALLRDKERDEVVLAHFCEDRDRWLGPRFSTETAARVFATFEYGIPAAAWQVEARPPGL